MADALARHESAALAAPNNAQGMAQMLDACLRTAAQLKNARGLLPEALRTEGEIVAVLLAGSELGIPPMAALRGLQVVRGKVIISYDTMVALLKRAGYRVSWPVATKTSATLRLTAPSGETHEETWDEARAKTAGLWGKGTWAQYPDTMLKARCVSSAAKAFAGEVLSGVYIEDEVEAIQATASTGSAEVRELGAALHDVPEATGNVDPCADAMAALAKCSTDADLFAWITRWSETIERAPDDSRRRGNWDAVKARARNVVPPVQVARVTTAFGEARAARARAAKSAAPIEGEVADPVDELASVETAEGALAWAADHLQWLGAIPRESAEEERVWAAVRAMCDRIEQPSLVDKIEALVS